MGLFHLSEHPVGGRATTRGVTLTLKDAGEAKDLHPDIIAHDKGFFVGEVAERVTLPFIQNAP
jgi:hypothetical protein